MVARSPTTPTWAYGRAPVMGSGRRGQDDRYLRGQQADGSDVRRATARGRLFTTHFHVGWRSARGAGSTRDDWICTGLSRPGGRLRWSNWRGRWTGPPDLDLLDQQREFRSATQAAASVQRSQVRWQLRQLVFVVQKHGDRGRICQTGGHASQHNLGLFQVVQPWCDRWYCLQDQRHTGNVVQAQE